MASSVAPRAPGVIGAERTALDDARTSGGGDPAVQSLTVAVVFEARTEPARERAERWRHVLEQATGPLEPRGIPDRCVAGAMGAVSVVEMVAGGEGGAMRVARHLRSSDPERCKIDVVAHGHGVVEQGGREAGLAPGDLAVVDLTRPATWAMSGPLRMVAVTFPRAMLPLPADDLERLTAVRLAGDHGPVALVSALARQLPRHLDEYAAADGARLGTAVLDLLSAALAARSDAGARLPRETRRRALLVQVHAYIEERLGDPALSPGGVAAANYISVRYLHKLFETEQTTVAEWIRRRRLERCRRDLLDPALAGRSVDAIGRHWGLTDAAHFSRVFKRRFGAPPAEYRRLHGPSR
jgi:AraC-like DNA-binding protein